MDLAESSDLGSCKIIIVSYFGMRRWSPHLTEWSDEQGCNFKGQTNTYSIGHCSAILTGKRIVAYNHHCCGLESCGLLVTFGCDLILHTGLWKPLACVLSYRSHKLLQPILIDLLVISSTSKQSHSQQWQLLCICHHHKERITLSHCWNPGSHS